MIISNDELKVSVCKNVAKNVTSHQCWLGMRYVKMGSSATKSKICIVAFFFTWHGKSSVSVFLLFFKLILLTCVCDYIWLETNIATKKITPPILMFRFVHLWPQCKLCLILITRQLVGVFLYFCILSRILVQILPLNVWSDSNFWGRLKMQNRWELKGAVDSKHRQIDCKRGFVFSLLFDGSFH